MKIQERVSLKDFTTFRIGGTARFFCAVESLDDLMEAVILARKAHVPFFVLGGGSNVLISDDGFDGLVIKMEMKGIAFHRKKDRVEVVAAAGESWDTLVDETVKRGFFGLENLSGIPGTVGAAPVQNIGAYGSEGKDVVDHVEAFDPGQLKKRVF